LQFNCAESCNFALEDWLPFGRESVEKYRKLKRSSVFAFDELVCNAATSPRGSVEAQKYDDPAVASASSSAAALSLCNHQFALQSFS
jgi:hypothetical protein